MHQDVEVGEDDYKSIRRDVNVLLDDARNRVDKINRKPHQPGYSLELRRQAAFRGLVRQGYSPEEAERTVDAMESRGLLPDPPQR